MAFLKLDTGILNSTLWVDKDCREVFLTALLMAEPYEVMEPVPQLEVRTLTETGFVVPVGWYGFVRAAGVGIIRTAMTETEAGMLALERLGSPDPESRNRRFDGRRLVRVNGGYIALNFMDFRDRDHTAAERSARYRARQKKLADAATRDGVDATRDETVASQPVTQADADAQAEFTTSSSSSVERLIASLPTEVMRVSWRAEISAAKHGAHGKPLNDAQIELACRDFIGNGHTAEKPALRHFRAFLTSGGKLPRSNGSRKGNITEGREKLAAWMEQE